MTFSKCYQVVAVLFCFDGTLFYSRCCQGTQGSKLSKCFMQTNIYFFLRKSKYYSFIRFNSSDHQTNYFLSTKLLISFLLFFAFSVKFGRKVQYVNYLHEVSNKSFNTQSIIIVKQFQFNYYLCFYYYLLLYFNRFN